MTKTKGTILTALIVSGLIPGVGYLWVQSNETEYTKGKAECIIEQKEIQNELLTELVILRINCTKSDSL